METKGLSPEAEVIFNKLLDEVPAIFRSVAKNKAMEVALSYSQSEFVTPHELVSSYIKAMPVHMHNDLALLLQKAGVNIEQYRDLFAKGSAGNP